MGMKIKINPLDERSIDNAIEMIDMYTHRIESKKQELITKLGEIGLSVLELRFSNFYYAGENDIKVHIDVEGYDKVVITAQGKALCFIEFGTGVLFTRDQNPYTKDFGFERGTYGKGKGSNPKGWTYYGEQGTAGEAVPGKPGVYRTYGNSSANAFPEAVERMLSMILVIAKEVFR